MSDTRIEIDSEKRLIIRFPLDVCEQCGALMITMYGDARHLPQRLRDKIKQLDIREEHYRKWDICDRCINDGNYTETCTICNGEHPINNLAFELRWYPKYADDETTYEYICKPCTLMFAQKIINLILKADDVKDLRKG